MKRKATKQQKFIASVIDNIKKSDWPKEMKILKTLEQEYPIDFLLTLRVKVPSLASFLTDYWANWLKQKHYSFLAEPKVAVSVFEETEKDDTILDKMQPNKTLRKFLS